MTSQLTLDGNDAAPNGQRAGAIGKVQRLLDEQPWLTCGEIAAAVKEPSKRVSEALNKLKHEGRAVREERRGARFRDVWATPESGASRPGLERLAVLDRQRAEREIAEGKVAGDIDWRPTETIPEDYYAL